jgi:hypothetical protein
MAHAAAAARRVNSSCAIRRTIEDMYQLTASAACSRTAGEVGPNSRANWSARDVDVPGMQCRIVIIGKRRLFRRAHTHSCA